MQLWESILTDFYASQTRLESSNVRQPLHHEDSFYEGGKLMSEKLLWYIGTVNPLQLWIIQLSIIISTAALLSFVLREIRQPKVIAEVLSGIVLGPTVCGRIPGFTRYVFPPDSQPYLNLIADIGLCLFFFLVGLQIEPSVVKKNIRVSVIIALAGMIIPFITGAGLSVLLYQEFVHENVQATYFMFFSGVAFSVTAFPVMCRILRELKLQDTTVGAVVISAGAGNDIIGWALLALSVAMFKAGSSLGATYMILSCAVWTLILLFPVKSFLRILAETTGSIDNGPSILFMTVNILILFSSALVTDINGVHSIFGAFLTGLIVPREGNLATLMTEKLDDMVEVIFLPFYFTLLGMSTNLLLLDDGITWVYTLSIILAAFMSKFSSCAIAAKYTSGFSWRESGAIGSLMSCKGLVELIVLDVGLSSGVFTQRVFTMFVLEALVLTFITTPLVIRLYPHDLRNCIVTESAIPDTVTAGNSYSCKSRLHGHLMSKRRFTVVVDKLEHLPAVMAFTQLFSPRLSNRPLSTALSDSAQKRTALSFEALRLIELPDYSCTVMKSSDSILKADHLLAILKMFGRLHALPITPAIDITPSDGLAESVIEHARSYGSTLIVLPWLLSSVKTLYQHTDSGETSLPYPHIGPTKLAANAIPKPSARVHAHFVQSILEHSSADVAVFLDWNVDSSIQGKTHQHLFLPFFGGPDDRFALDFVAQLCENDAISATVLRLVKKYQHEITSATQSIENRGTDPVNAESDTADEMAWEYHTSASSMDLNASPSRMAFKKCVTALPLHAIVREAHAIKQSGVRLLIVAGRSNHRRTDIDLTELSALVAEYGDLDADAKKTIGVVATAIVTARSGDGVLVLQRASCHLV